MIGIRKFDDGLWYVCQRDISKDIKAGETVDVYSKDCLQEQHIVSIAFETKEAAYENMLENMHYYEPDED